MTGKALAATTGGGGAAANIFDAAVKSGTVEIDFTPNNRPDTLTIYYPPRAKGGKQIYSTGGPVVNSTVQNPIIAPFSGTSTLFEIVINEGLPGDPSNVWSYSGLTKDATGKQTTTVTMNQTTSSTTPAPTPVAKPTPVITPRVASSSTSTRGYYRTNLRTLLRTLTQ